MPLISLFYCLLPPLPPVKAPGGRGFLTVSSSALSPAPCTARGAQQVLSTFAKHAKYEPANVTASDRAYTT